METLSKNRVYAIFAVLFLAWLVGHIDKVAISFAIMPIGQEFGFTASQKGMIMSAFSIGYATMAIFGGILVDKYGPRKVLTILMTVWSIFTALIAFGWSLISFIIIRTIFGGAEGCFSPSSSAAVAQLFPNEQRGRAKSFLVSAAAAGGAIGSIAISALIVLVGWRGSFLICGGIGLLIAILFFFLYQTKSEQTGTKNQNGVQQAKQIVPVKQCLKISLIWKVAFIQITCGIFGWGLISWMPTYWVQVKNLSMVFSGTLQAVSLLLCFLFMNLAGWLMDKFLYGRERILMSVCLIITIICMFLMYSLTSVTANFVCYTVATSFMSMMSPILLTLMIKYIPKEFVGTATGITAFGFSIGGAIAPTLMGFLIQIFNGSFSAVFIGIIITSFISLGVTLVTNTKKYITDPVEGNLTV